MEERNEEKESLEMESEKRILVTSQMEEVPESLRYPRSEESVSKDCLTQELKEGSVEENLEVRLGYIGTGLHNKLEVPEAKTLLEVNGQINGKVARILLDTGCSTYVLSTQFATRHNIEKTPMKLRSVDLAVSGVGAQLAYKTGLTKIRIGNTEVEKSLYLLPIQQFDAIVGMPFFIENEVNLSELETGDIEINGTKVRLKDNLDISSEEMSNNMNTLTIATISRKTLKKELRHNRVNELYLTMIRNISEDKKEGGTSGYLFEKNRIPKWIEKEYGEIFQEGLPPGMPPTRTVDHQIPLKADMPPSFKGIFRLSQFELQELKKRLDQLLKDGKINASMSPYGAPVLFVKKKDSTLRMCIIELSTLKQFRILMLYLELTNYSIVYMEQKSIRKSILQVDIIKLRSILKTDIKQLFEHDMDITNSMLCHLV